MDAAGVTKVPRLDHPDAAEIQFDQFHGGVGDLLELLLKRRRQDQLFLKPVDPLESPQRPRTAFLGLPSLGHVHGGAGNELHGPLGIPQDGGGPLHQESAAVLGDHDALAATGKHAAAN